MKSLTGGSEYSNCSAIVVYCVNPFAAGVHGLESVAKFRFMSETSAQRWDLLSVSRPLSLYRNLGLSYLKVEWTVVELQYKKAAMPVTEIQDCI